MIFGCGTDIEEKDRFNKHYFDKGKLSDLMYDIFTTREIENFSVFGKEAFLKGFSFKEAFYKAANWNEIDFKDIEIIFDDDNHFQIYPSKNLKVWLDFNHIEEIEADFQSSSQYVNFKVILIQK